MMADLLEDGPPEEVKTEKTLKVKKAP